MLSSKEKQLLETLEDSIKSAGIKLRSERNGRDLDSIWSESKTLSQYMLISGLYNELEQEDNNAELYFQILRSILLADIYKYRGDSFKSYHKALKTIFSKTLSIEALDLGMLVLEKLIKSASFHKDNKNLSYAKLNYNIIKVKYRLIRNADSIYLKYLEIKSDSRKKKFEFNYFRFVFEKLNQLYLETNSEKIKTNSLLVNIDTCYIGQSLDEYLKASLEYFDFVKSKKRLFSKSKRFNAEINVAVAYVRNNKKLEANSIINKINTEGLSEYNNSVLCYIKYYSSFYYLNSLDFKVIKNNYLSILFNMKINLIKLTDLYLDKNYKDCLIHIRNLEVVEDPEDDFHLYYRLLTIYIHIELELYDYSSTLIENFRKYIERNDQKIDQVQRWMLIKRVLVALSKSSFDFKKCFNKISRYIDILSSKEPKYRWVPFTSEVLPFNIWFLSRAKVDTSKFEYIHYFKNRI